MAILLHLPLLQSAPAALVDTSRVQDIRSGTASQRLLGLTDTLQIRADFPLAMALAILPFFALRVGLAFRRHESPQ